MSDTKKYTVKIVLRELNEFGRHSTLHFPECTLKEAKAIQMKYMDAVNNDQKVFWFGREDPLMITTFCCDDILRIVIDEE